MSESAFQKIRGGLEEAKGVHGREAGGVRGHRTVRSRSLGKSEAQGAPPEKRERLKQEALAELAAKTL